jgi:hypothetical protein
MYLEHGGITAELACVYPVVLVGLAYVGAGGWEVSYLCICWALSTQYTIEIYLS